MWACLNDEITIYLLWLFQREMIDRIDCNAEQAVLYVETAVHTKFMISIGWS